MTEEITRGIIGIAGAIIGAIIVGLFNWWTTKKNKKEKKLAVYSTYSSRLIEVSDLIKGNIEIRMNNREIKELNKNEIILINTGNLIIKNTEVYFELSEENAALVNVEKTHSNFNISLDDFNIEFDSTHGKISINYLNPGDEINFTLLTDMRTNINLKHRQEEVSTEIKTDYNPETPGVILDAFYNAISSNLAMSLIFALGAPDFRRFKKRKKESSNKNAT